jgi:hypothetical protein
MHRNQHGVDRPLAHDAQCIGNRVAVHDREATVARRVNPGALTGQEHGSDGRRGLSERGSD